MKKAYIFAALVVAAALASLLVACDKAGGEGAQAPSKEEGLVSVEMKLFVNGNLMEVVWEENDTVAALKNLVSSKPLTVQTTEYGNFEQVGPLGTTLPRKDVQMTTQPGDVVLYAGNQMVLFYGSNSWSYTKLGTIVGMTQQQLANLLGGRSVQVVVSCEN